MEANKQETVKTLKEGFVTEFREKMTELKKKKDAKIAELTKQLQEATKEQVEMAAKLEATENSLQSAGTQHADTVQVIKAQHEAAVLETTSQLQSQIDKMSSSHEEQLKQLQDTVAVKDSEVAELKQSVVALQSNITELTDKL